MKRGSKRSTIGLVRWTQEQLRIVFSSCEAFSALLSSALMHVKHHKTWIAWGCWEWKALVLSPRRRMCAGRECSATFKRRLASKAQRIKQTWRLQVFGNLFRLSYIKGVVKWSVSRRRRRNHAQTQSIIPQFDVWAQFSSCFHTIRQYYCKGRSAWHSQRVMVEEEYLLAHATLSADRDRWQVQSLSRCNCCMLHFAFSCCSRFVFALVHWCGAFVPNPHVGFLLNSSHGQSLYISHHFLSFAPFRLALKETSQT